MAKAILFVLLVKKDSIHEDSARNISYVVCELMGFSLVVLTSAC